MLMMMLLLHTRHLLLTPIHATIAPENVTQCLVQVCECREAGMHKASCGAQSAVRERCIYIFDAGQWSQRRHPFWQILSC